MEIHLKKLESICRLCKLKIHIDKSYITVKSAASYAKEFFSLFQYNITDDLSSIHPKNLCNNCRRKLDKIKEQTVIPVEIAKFNEHDHDCLLCFRKMGFDKFTYKLEFVKEEKSVAELKVPISYDLMKSLIASKGYTLLNEDANGAMFCMIEIRESSNPVILYSLKVFSDMSWCFYVNGKILLNQIDAFLNLTTNFITNDNSQIFLNVISSLRLCPGNPDFPEVIATKFEKGSSLDFFDSAGFVQAKVQSQYFVNMDSLQTIRAVNCEKLISNFVNRCESCNKVRKNLNVQSHRLLKVKTQVLHKNIPHVHMSHQQLSEKCVEQQQEIKQLRQWKRRNTARLKKIIEHESVALDTKVDELISETVLKNDPIFPENSAKKLLWEEQKKQCKLNNKKGMRWHPIIIRFALSLYLKSPGAYELLRNSGFLELPHKSTLNTYTGFTSSGSGFNPDILKRMYVDLKIGTMCQADKQCIVAFDEMHIKANLIYSKISGTIVGFTELGSINEELDAFERNFKQQQSKQIATHILCFMVRGLLSRYAYPIGYFSSCGFSSDQLYTVAWEAVRLLETLGLEVVAMVADGAAPNRRFFRLHSMPDNQNQSDDGVVYWAVNKFRRDQKIYFFSDVPHLIKTLRNNLENSGSHQMTRHLKRKGKDLSWKHIVEQYEFDLDVARQHPGMNRRTPKITEDHIVLNPRSRMRVNLAAQVLSKTMADAMAHRHLDSTSETELFVRNIDTFFDALNVANVHQGIRSRKEALYPYKIATDWRLKWLKETFLKYVNSWKEECENMDANTKEFKSRCCLSMQTIEGIRLTVHSFVELVPYLLQFSKYGKDCYFLSDKLNQDCIEEHFGRIRMRGGGRDNPTQYDYGLMNRKLIVAKTDLLQVVRGNTRGRSRDNLEIDFTDERRLPKRVRKK